VQELGINITHLFAVGPTTAIAFVKSQETEVYVIGLERPPRQLGVTGWPATLENRECVKCRDSIFVFGDDNESLVMELDLRTRKWIPARNDERAPRMLRYALCASEKKIWMHGGLSTIGRPEGMLYTIEISGDRFHRANPEPLSFNDD
jgi:hypothetical protein